MAQTLGYYVQRLKNNSLGYMSNDRLGDVDWVHLIEKWLMFLYSYMNWKGSWYYSNYSEQIVATSPKLYNTTFRFWQVYQCISLTSRWEFQDHLTQRNIAARLIQNPTRAYANEDLDSEHIFVKSWENEFAVSKDYSTLEITYSRFPKKHDYNKLEEDLDVPEEAFIALDFICMWYLYPSWLEQGASLSSFFYAQAVAALDMYSKNIGLSSAMVWMIA